MENIAALTLGSWIGVALGYYVTGSAEFSLPFALGVTFCAAYIAIIS